MARICSIKGLTTGQTALWIRGEVTEAGGAPSTCSAFGPWATNTGAEGKGAVLAEVLGRGLGMHWLFCIQRHHIFKYKVVLSHWNLHYLWKGECLLAPNCMIAWTYSELEGAFKISSPPSLSVIPSLQLCEKIHHLGMCKLMLIKPM